MARPLYTPPDVGRPMKECCLALCTEALRAAETGQHRTVCIPPGIYDSGVGHHLKSSGHGRPFGGGNI